MRLLASSRGESRCSLTSKDQRTVNEGDSTVGSTLASRRMLCRLLYVRTNTLWRLFRWTLVVLLLWTAVDLLLVRRAIVRNEQKNPQIDPGRVYIASIHWNNEAILKGHWTSRVAELANALGRDNVFVSVKESGSWDNTKEALSELGYELDRAQIRSKIVLDNVTHEEEINKAPADVGWVWTTRNKMELRRIPYLANQRNEAMAPFWQMDEDGERFDKILFLGDVVFTLDDVFDLLATRNGEYAAACAMDFKQAPYFYDSFAMRDSEGEEPLMLSWPFFRSRQSRRAVKAGEPIPATSCWNGMAVFDAAPFYEQGLGFRGVPDSLASHHVEGSECCLIHADNALSSQGVWVNPRVRVAYDQAVYENINARGMLSVLEIVSGSWINRILRWSTTTWFKKRVVQGRMEGWKRRNESHAEAAGFCLINEMQVLAPNGWAHV